MILGLLCLEKYVHLDKTNEIRYVHIKVAPYVKHTVKPKENENERHRARERERERGGEYDKLFDS